MAEAAARKSKFELLIGAVDKLSGPFAGMSARTEAFSKNVDKLGKSFGKLSNATGLDRMSSSLGGVFRGVKNVWQEGRNGLAQLASMAGKLGLALGAAGGGALALAKSTAMAGDAAAKAAARAGVGMSVWQEYLHAAELSGVSAEELSKGFLKLQDMTLKGAQGDKTQSGLLKLMGINPKNTRGEVKAAEAMYLELADKIKALVDAGQQGKASNLLMQALGEEGVKLMPMLANGSKALKEMRLEAHTLGLVFDGEAAKASVAFNESLSKAGKSLKGIGYSIGNLLLPKLTPLIDKFTALSVKLRENIGTGFAEWVDKINVDELWQGIERGLGKLKDLWASLKKGVEWLGGWGNVLKIVATIIAGKFIVALGALALAFGKLGLAILTTPVGWFLGAIAAVAGAVYLIYKNWDGISSYFRGLWQEVKAAFQNNWFEGIVKVLLNFNPMRWVFDGVNELIKYFTGLDFYSIGKDWINGIWKGMTQGWDNLVQSAHGLWSDFKGALGFGGDGPQAPAMASGRGGALGLGAPQNLGKNAAQVTQSRTRTEHVEKQQVTLRVEDAQGNLMPAHLVAPGAAAGSGVLMGGGGL